MYRSAPQRLHPQRHADRHGDRLGAALSVGRCRAVGDAARRHGHHRRRVRAALSGHRRLQRHRRCDRRHVAVVSRRGVGVFRAIRDLGDAGNLARREPVLLLDGVADVLSCGVDAREQCRHRLLAHDPRTDGSEAIRGPWRTDRLRHARALAGSHAPGPSRSSMRPEPGGAKSFECRACRPRFT